VGISGNVFPAQKVDALKDISIIDICAGDDHSLFLQKNGDVWAAGSNQAGQLGVSEISESNVPVLVEDLKREIYGNKVKILHSGEKSSHVLTSNGEVWCWGSNQFGECATTEEIKFLKKTAYLPPNFKYQQIIIIINKKKDLN